MTEIVEGSSEVRAVLSIFEKGKAELGKIIAGQTGAHRAGHPHLPLRRPRSRRRRPRRGQDHDRQNPGPLPRARLPPHPGHARYDARRHSRHQRLLPQNQRIHLPSRPRLHPVFARRRNQPHAPAHAGRIARKHGRTPGHHRRRYPHPRRLLHRLRHAKSPRIRRHLPAPRSPARPFPRQDSRQLPQRRRRTHRPRAPPRQRRLAAVRISRNRHRHPAGTHRRPPRAPRRPRRASTLRLPPRRHPPHPRVARHHPRRQPPRRRQSPHRRQRPMPQKMAATSSFPTTSSRPRCPAFAIASSSKPKPSSRASTPTASSPTSSPPPRCPSDSRL